MSTKEYPAEITPEMLPQWAHLTDAEIANDALVTLAEIKTFQRLGVAESDERIAERCEFVHFLHRLQSARSDHVFERNPLYIDRSNPSQLSERIFLAGAATAREHTELRALGITALVNLTPDDYGCAEAGFKMLHLAIDDAVALDPANVARFLAQMIAWEESDETVLIHCHAGISRTSAFAIAWLMHKRGANAESDLHTMWSDAESLVEIARPIIMPHYLLKRAVLDHFAQRESSDATAWEQARA